MTKKCIVLNDREPIDETVLSDVTSNFKIDVVWCQDAIGSFYLKEILEKNSDANIIITTYMDLSAENLSKLPSLEVIITTTISVHYIDIKYCEAKGIKVFNSVDYTGHSVAEHCVALMMSAARKIVNIDRQVRAGDNNCFEHPGMELHGKKAGIIGFGNIGRRVASILKGFGIDVVYYDPYIKDSVDFKSADFNDLIQNSDIIFLILSLNETSKDLIDESALKQMKATAILVNVCPDAPEGVIKRKALINALKNKQIGAAALDLLEPQHYINFDNTVLTCRRGWYTKECVNRRINIWKNILIDYLSK